LKQGTVILVRLLVLLLIFLLILHLHLHRFPRSHPDGRLISTYQQFDSLPYSLKRFAMMRRKTVQVQDYEKEEDEGKERRGM
jgi:hypothetical protein